MKAWEIIGWAHDGALYHDGCEPSEARGEDEAPIFASAEIAESDACDHCLHAWIESTEPDKREEGAPAYVYIAERY